MGLFQGFEIFGEAVVEQGSWAAITDSLDDVGAWHAEFVKDKTGHECGAVVTHAAMRQDTVSRCDQARSQGSERVELVEIGQGFVIDREIDIEALIWDGGHAAVNVAFEIDDCIHFMGGECFPVGDRG